MLQPRYFPAHGETDGARDAAPDELQLAKFSGHRVAVCQYRGFHVFQLQAIQFFCETFFRFQRYQRRQQGFQRKPQVLQRRYKIAVGTGSGVRGSPGADDYCTCVQCMFRSQFHFAFGLAAEILSVPAAVIFHSTVTDAGYLPGLHHKAGSLGAGHQTAACGPQRGKQYVDDIFCFSGCGKHPAAPFRYGIQSQFLKEAQQVFVGKLLQRAV